LPEIPVFPTRHPDPRKTIFQQQTQNQPGVLAIDLLLAYWFTADLRRIADPQLDVQLGHESFQPTVMSTGFHPNLDADSLGREIVLRLFRFLTIFQWLLSVVSRFRTYERNLLETGVIIRA